MAELKDALVDDKTRFKEIGVIDYESIVRSVEEERKLVEREYTASGRKEEYGVTGPLVWDEIAVPKITDLRLSYHKLVKIDNLESLSSLVELRLDNNSIKEIVGIGHLVTLEWLDLSFNQISKIEGLSNLTRLTDLSLFQNKVKKVEGLEDLHKLEVLSLGRNELDTLDDTLMDLRNLTSVRVLNLEGNPLCAGSEYRATTLAYLPNLRYLDYQRISQEERTLVLEQNQHIVVELKELDGTREALEKKEKELAAQSEKMQTMGMEIVVNLTNQLFLEDEDGKRVEAVPGILIHIEAYKEKLAALLARTSEKALESYGDIQAETKASEAALREMQKKANDDSLKLVQGFLKHKKHTMRDAEKEAEEKHESGPLLKAIGKLRSDLQELRIQLIAIEVNLSERCMTSLDDFSRQVSELQVKRNEFLFNYFFREVEKAENVHKENIMTTVSTLIEQAAEDESILVELGEETATMLQDREVALGAVTTSYELHISRILAADERMRASENKREKALVQGAYDKEQKRNRDRMIEISHLCDFHDGELVRIKAEELDEED